MHASVIKALDLMVEEGIESDEWDEMPTLLIMYGDDKENPSFALVALAGDIFESLRGVGPQLRGKLDGVFGAILMNEGWGLSSEKLGKGVDIQKVAAELTASGKRYSDHPAAVETKMFYAIDGEGIEARHYQRGETAARNMSDGEGKVTGRVPDHLTALWLELTP